MKTGKVYWICTFLVLNALLAWGQVPDDKDFNTVFYEYFSQGQYQEAEQVCQKRIDELFEEVLDQSFDLSIAYTNLAHAQEAQEKLKEAENSFNSALSITSKAFGSESQLTAINHQNLGVFLYRQNNLDKAIGHFEQSILIQTELFGVDNQKIVEDLVNLGLAYEKKIEYDSAEVKFLKALDQRKLKYEDDHELVVEVAMHLFKFYDHSRDFEKRDEVHDLYKLKLEKTDCNCDKKDSLVTDNSTEEKPLLILNLDDGGKTDFVENSEAKASNSKTAVSFSDDMKTNPIILLETTNIHLSNDTLTRESIKKEDSLITQNASPALIPQVPEYHVVGKEETLYSISKKYGIGLQAIKKLNSIENNLIYLGQKIKLR